MSNQENQVESARAALEEMLVCIISDLARISEARIEIYFTEEGIEDRLDLDGVFKVNCEVEVWTKHYDFGFELLDTAPIFFKLSDDHKYLMRSATTIKLPKPLMDIFESHYANPLFENVQFMLSGRAELCVERDYRCYMMNYLAQALLEFEFDEMSDTMLRSSYAQIYSEMEEFQRWIGFAAVMHEGMIDYQNAERLQKHLNIILEYVGNGRTLPFEKLTTLCDVAGSLQPVVSLIRKNLQVAEDAYK